jgi:hypothetical protein
MLDFLLNRFNKMLSLTRSHTVTLRLSQPHCPSLSRLAPGYVTQLEVAGLLTHIRVTVQDRVFMHDLLCIKLPSINPQCRAGQGNAMNSPLSWKPRMLDRTQ